MPFTLSHPAAVLPFLRTGLPASALVAGSVVPDLPFYLPVDLGIRTHTALAVVTVDLAGGLLLWALWHVLLAAPVVATAPVPLRARLPAAPGPRRPDGVRRITLLVVAVVLGAATHVLWDEFTHPRRWGAEHVPALAASYAGRPGYDWLQDLGGPVGGLVVALWVLRWWRRTPPRPVRGGAPWAWLGVATVSLGAGAVGGAGQGDVRSAAVLAAFGAGTAAVVTVVALAAVWQVHRRLSS